MDQTQKEYKYEEVLEYAGSGGDMDKALKTLQGHLVELRKLVNDCEPLYHGKSSSSPVYTQYQKLYNNIGDQNNGMWNQVYGAVQIQNIIYSNAKSDEENDKKSTL